MNKDLGKTSGYKEFKGAIVMSRVDDKTVLKSSLSRGLRIFLMAEQASYEPIRVRISKDHEVDFVEKVNSLMGKTVDVIIYRSPWQVGTKSGVINYLQSIEESK